MTRSVALCLLGTGPAPVWKHGEVVRIAPVEPAVVQATTAAILGAAAEAVLFWDPVLGEPDPECATALLEQTGDVWHAGLRLGTGGQPGIIDFIHPVWMHNRDPVSNIEATSWRLSLRACLVRTEVLRQLGGPCGAFRSLNMAGLELGHRYLRRGALVRHLPELVTSSAILPPLSISTEDELRFALYRFGRKWTRWAVGRALLTGYRPRVEWLAAWRQVRHEERPEDVHPFRRSEQEVFPPSDARVTVLIPTMERYPYLHTVLHQLRTQTVRPHEVIVVDQTPWSIRNLSYREQFSDLPLRVIERDKPGQCSARNAGLLASEGDYVLFIDDDDEVGPDLIERHLGNLERFGCEVSSGVADEAGTGPLPLDSLHVQASSVFPTNNTLIKKDVLRRSGLFDLAYDQGRNEDGDLGIRVYLAGALMVLDPQISVFHHHAPHGGLRAHKARVITYASSRQKLMHRNVPSVSEIYMSKRYFTERQVREALWMRVLGTFSLRGSRWKRLAKIVVSLVLLPDTLWKIYRRYKHTRVMLRKYPQIPQLPSCSQEGKEK